MIKPPSFCIHGHFYQPPRENPWIEEIELQESAAPFSDWNERIHFECYLPNAMARVFDDKGRVMDIVNNFEMMNFNFGPTLLSWVARKHPETYQYILDADCLSQLRHHGHGNAIAQVYNHVIMPLASHRDKITQVKWGVRDFQSRFKRDPESIWLSETACNEETLEVLVQEGIKYLILGPHQAESVRLLGSEHWRDVSMNQIDPKVPYRCFLRSDPNRYIDIFFYDGPISKSLGFEDLAYDANRFMDRIDKAKSHEGSREQLVSIATDGETYGHHKPYGDRVVAYTLRVEAPRRNYRIVNYGEFLELHPPTMEVRLKSGENGEGTAWSCPHGIKRWKDHCGCRGGGPGEWNQHWRKPLREALDWLKTELDQVFEEAGSPLFRDVWEARNAYISVVLDRSEKSILAYMHGQESKPLSREEISVGLRLLEMQRHAMFMYTSCGWFFTEISGIETVQVLKYAARAIQLAQGVSGRPLEEEFLKRLESAKSNMPEFKDGRGVYDRLVRPSVTPLEKVASHYAISSLFSDYKTNTELYCYSIKLLHERREAFGNYVLTVGRIHIQSRLTWRQKDFMFVVIQIGPYDFRCSLKEFEAQEELDRVESELFRGLAQWDVTEIFKKIDGFFGSQYYTLKDLFLSERTRIVAKIAEESIAKVGAIYERLYDEHRRLGEIYHMFNLPIPEEIRVATKHTLQKRLKSEVFALLESRFDARRSHSIVRIMEVAKAFRVELSKDEIAVLLSQELSAKTQALVMEAKEELIQDCLNIQRLAQKIDVSLDNRAAQNHVFCFLKNWRDNPEGLAALSPGMIQDVQKLSTTLGINPGDLKKEGVQGASL